MSNAIFTQIADKTKSEEEADILVNYAVELARTEGTMVTRVDPMVPEVLFTMTGSIKFLVI